MQGTALLHKGRKFPGGNEFTKPKKSLENKMLRRREARLEFS